MLVIGEKEQQEQTVSARKQGQGDIGTFTIEQFVEHITNEINKELNI